ncbi:MAG TPA: hypothetical protein VNI01_16685, partial [Elusimicrobiota bacterium]|nr:hypothetical protein [Elusimicrobiota bacterium]
MDPAFPFLLPPELELLVLAYAADRGVVCALLRAACQDGQMHLARRVTDVFDSEAALIDARSALALACGGGHLELARWLAGHFAVTWLGNDHALVGACACGHLPMIRWLSAGFGLTESLIMNTVTAAGNWPVMHWALSCRALTVGG